MADVGIEYGIALYEISVSENIKDEVKEGLDLLIELVNENPTYMSMLSSPAISKDERFSLLDEALKGKVNKYVISFLKTLIRNNHTKQLKDAYYHYKSLYEDSKSLKEAIVISSDALSDSSKEKVETYIKNYANSSVLIDYKIDKSLIGGIVIEIDGKRIDGSIKRKLSDIKKVMRDEF